MIDRLGLLGDKEKARRNIKWKLGTTTRLGHRHTVFTTKYEENTNSQLIEGY